MVDLDSPQTYRELDASGMREHLHAFPEQCRHAWDKALRFALPEDYGRIDRVIFLGMGGSAIGGDIVADLAEARVPVWVHRDYGLPRFVNDKTLLIASSYSGNTEETLSAFSQALNTPAKKLVLTLSLIHI